MTSTAFNQQRKQDHWAILSDFNIILNEKKAYVNKFLDALSSNSFFPTINLNKSDKSF